MRMQQGSQVPQLCSRVFGHIDNRFHLLPDFNRQGSGIFGEVANLQGDNRKASARLTSPRSFNRSINGEQMGTFCNPSNFFEKFFNVAEALGLLVY